MQCWPGDLASLERPVRWDNGANKSRRDRVLTWSYQPTPQTVDTHSTVQPTFSVAEIVLKVSFYFFLLSCFLQQNDIWILRLGNEIFSKYSKCSQWFSPWVEECWPSSADSCQDHPTSRPCASAPGRHWTSCPWWLSSPCPRCCLSRRKSLPPRGSCVQEPRRKPVV